MKYKAKVTHAIFKAHGRPRNFYIVRGDIDTVETDKELSPNKYPFFYVVDVAEPSISCASNMVTISAPKADSVYYTTDGADPDMTKTKYTGPFAIASTVTVKAIAYYGEIASDIVSKPCTYVPAEEETIIL